MAFDGSSSQPGEVIVQLLDPATMRALTSWRFLDQVSISIGRSTDRDVLIDNPYVSRLHAELLFVDGQWTLFARGRNGLVVDEKALTEVPLAWDQVIRLGPSGPLLRFREKDEGVEHFSTLCFSTIPLEQFQLDKEKLNRELWDVMKGDYFQSLMQSAKDLRKRRDGMA